MMLQSHIEKKSKMHAMNPKLWKNRMRGYTLVELMIVVALTGIAVIAIYRGYQAFSLAADAQEQIIEMQQNLRIGMYWLEKDIRRAGMNEENDDTAGFTFAADDTIEFSMDLGGLANGTYEDIRPCTGNPSGDGDVLDSCEVISYALLDPDGDGVWSLYRNDEIENPGSNGDQIITNIDALNFVYLDEDQEDTIDPDTDLNDPAAGRNSIVGSDPRLERIRSVQIAMVVRTTNEDFRYTNNEQYRNLQNSLIYTAPGDNFRRRLLIKQIKVRNAGL
jgi:prepilin-type N-terminal cleavage/methylation domain-containing protein